MINCRKERGNAVKLVNVKNPNVEIDIRDYLVPDYLGTHEWKLPDKKVNKKQSSKQFDIQNDKKEDQ